MYVYTYYVTREQCKAFVNIIYSCIQVCLGHVTANDIKCTVFCIIES